MLDAEEKDLLRQITKNPQEAALHPTVSVNAMDLDGDGATSVSDILTLLSAFGEMCPN